MAFVRMCERNQGVVCGDFARRGLSSALRESQSGVLDLPRRPRSNQQHYSSMLKSLRGEVQTDGVDAFEVLACKSGPCTATKKYVYFIFF